MRTPMEDQAPDNSNINDNEPLEAVLSKVVRGIEHLKVFKDLLRRGREEIEELRAEDSYHVGGGSNFKKSTSSAFGKDTFLGVPNSVYNGDEAALLYKEKVQADQLLNQWGIDADGHAGMLENTGATDTSMSLSSTFRSGGGVGSSYNKFSISIGGAASSSRNRSSTTQEAYYAQLAYIRDAFEPRQTGGMAALASLMTANGSPQKANFLSSSSASKRRVSSSDDDDDDVDSDEDNRTSSNVLPQYYRRSQNKTTKVGKGTYIDVDGKRRKIPNINVATLNGGITQKDFVDFIAPAMTNSTDPYVNRCLAAQLDANANGIIMWDEFSAFFVQRSKMAGGSDVKISNTQFFYANGAKHHAMISKILFSSSSSSAKSGSRNSWNPALDRYCFTGGFDGTVHMWDSQFMDHVERVHYIPDANKQKRWINDMCFTSAGKLAVCQGRGFMYIYSVAPHGRTKSKPLLHRVLRAGKHSAEDDYENVIRMQIERNKFGSAAPSTRLTATTVPPWEICTLNTVNSNADIMCCAGIRGGVTGAHMEPLAVGFDNGRCSIYNVHKPIDIVTHIDPLETFDFFAGGSVHQVFDDDYDSRLLCLGSDKVGNCSVHFVDYEKMVPVMAVHPHHASGGSSAAAGGVVGSMPQQGGAANGMGGDGGADHARGRSNLSRFDYDPQSGILVASGPSRCATLFSSSFPDPVAYLHDHNAPIVGSMLNASQFHLYTVTEDCTFHLYDLRMNRKVMAATDSDGSSESTFSYSCAAFDATRGSCVAGSTIPIALRETMEGGSLPTAGEGGELGSKQRASGKDGIGSASLPASPQQGAKSAAATAAPTAAAVPPNTGSLQQNRMSAVQMSPSGEEDLRYTTYNKKFSQMIAVEGGCVVVRSAADDFVAPVHRFHGIATGCCAISCDNYGRRFAIAWGNKLSIFSAMTGAELTSCSIQLPTPSDEVTQITFGETPLTSCVVIGSFQGHIFVFEDETNMNFLHTRQLSGAIVGAEPAANFRKVFFATSQGTVYQMNLDTFATHKLFSYATVNPLSSVHRLSSSSSGQDGPEFDELDDFSKRSFAALNKSCESIAVMDPSHFAVLYGTGTVCFCKVVNLETLIMCSFPSTATGVSGSCIAADGPGGAGGAEFMNTARSPTNATANTASSGAGFTSPSGGSSPLTNNKTADSSRATSRLSGDQDNDATLHQIAVGDFDGNVTIFSLEKYFNTDPRHASSAVGFYHSMPSGGGGVLSNSSFGSASVDGGRDGKRNQIVDGLSASSRKGIAPAVFSTSMSSNTFGSPKSEVSIAHFNRRPTGSSSAHNGARARTSSHKAEPTKMMNTVYDYVSLKTHFTVANGRLIYSLFFTSPEKLLVTFQEDLSFIVCSTKGHLLQHITLMNLIENPCCWTRSTNLELGEHPFYTNCSRDEAGDYCSDEEEELDDDGGGGVLAGATSDTNEKGGTKQDNVDAFVVGVRRKRRSTIGQQPDKQKEVGRRTSGGGEVSPKRPSNDDAALANAKKMVPPIQLIPQKPSSTTTAVDKIMEEEGHHNTTSSNNNPLSALSASPRKSGGGGGGGIEKKVHVVPGVTGSGVKPPTAATGRSKTEREVSVAENDEGHTDSIVSVVPVLSAPPPTAASGDDGRSPLDGYGDGSGRDSYFSNSDRGGGGGGGGGDQKQLRRFMKATMPKDRIASTPRETATTKHSGRQHRITSAGDLQKATRRMSVHVEQLNAAAAKEARKNKLEMLDPRNLTASAREGKAVSSATLGSRVPTVRNSTDPPIDKSNEALHTVDDVIAMQKKMMGPKRPNTAREVTERLSSVEAITAARKSNMLTTAVMGMDQGGGDATGRTGGDGDKSSRRDDDVTQGIFAFLAGDGGGDGGALRSARHHKATNPGSSSAKCKSKAKLSDTPAITYPGVVPTQTKIVTQQVYTAHPPCFSDDLPRPTTPIFASAAAAGAQHGGSDFTTPQRGQKQMTSEELEQQRRLSPFLRMVSDDGYTMDISDDEQQSPRSERRKRSPMATKAAAKKRNNSPHKPRSSARRYQRSFQRDSHNTTTSNNKKRFDSPPKLIEMAQQHDELVRGNRVKMPGETTIQLERALRAAKSAAGLTGRGNVRTDHVFSQLHPVSLPNDVVCSVNEYSRRERERRQAAIKKGIVSGGGGNGGGSLLSSGKQRRV